MVTEGQLAIAGFVFKYFNKSRTFMRVLLSICICYGTVYVIERLSWTMSGKERQIKSHALSSISEQMNSNEVSIKESLKNQVKNNLNGYLSILCGSAEIFLCELNETLESYVQDISDLQSIIATCAKLSGSLQGILFEFDTAERALLQTT